MFIYFFQDIADPFFAYCKMHAEKVMSRAKRRNWLAIQSHIRKHPEKKIEDEKEKVGITVSRSYLNIYVLMFNFLVSITTVKTTYLYAIRKVQTIILTQDNLAGEV